MANPLYKVGDMVMIRPDLHETFYQEHYNDEDLEFLPEQCIKHNGQITEITYVEKAYEDYIWYRTKLREIDEDGDDCGEWWWMECALIPVNDLHTLNQALLNGKINIEAYEMAKEKLGESHGS